MSLLVAVLDLKVYSNMDKIMIQNNLILGKQSTINL